MVGIGRSLLALGSLSTLASNSSSVLLKAVTLPSPQDEAAKDALCGGVRALSLFCALDVRGAEAGRWIAIVILLVVLSGWRPRLTVLPHWWISFSLAQPLIIVDGGDQLTAVLTLLLVPIGLLDSRPFHWSVPPRLNPTVKSIACIALVVCQVQIAAVYFHSSLAKLGVTEWAEGSAIWYWFQDPIFGPPGWLRSVTLGAVAWWPIAAGMTWWPLIVEFALGLSLLFSSARRRFLFLLGVGLHTAILIFIQLPSFTVTMYAALVLLCLSGPLRPVDPARLVKPMPKVVLHWFATLGLLGGRDQSSSQVGWKRGS